MPSPSYTYTLANSTTADADQVMQNFNDILNGITDGTKDISINALTAGGTATLNGNVTLGNASADDLTINASLASSLAIKTTFSYDIGSATLGLKSLYLGSNDSAARSVRVIAGAVGSSYTLTLPTSGGTTGQFPVTNGSGTLSFRYIEKATSTQTSAYPATGDETTILCNASGGTFAVTLPAAATYTGKHFYIKKITTDTSFTAVTITPNGAETIDGDSSTTLNTSGETIKIISDGSGWQIVERRIPGTTNSYTPGVATTSGLSSRVGKWWRRGPMLCGKAYFTWSSQPAGSATWTIDIPSGLTIDTTALPGAGDNADEILGKGQWFQAVANDKHIIHVVYNSTSSFRFVMPVDNSDTGFGNVNYTDFRASDIFSIDFEVPISGWKG